MLSLAGPRRTINKAQITFFDAKKSPLLSRESVQFLVPSLTMNDQANVILLAGNEVPIIALKQTDQVWIPGIGY
jgi:hypothetical protein